MNHMLAVLELEKIKEEVKKSAATTVGKEMISSLNPATDLDYVSERLTEVTIGKIILEEYGIPPFGGIKDLRHILKKAEKGIALSPKELIDIKDTLIGIKSLKSFFKELASNVDQNLMEDNFSIVIDKGLNLELLPKLEKELNRCLDEYGEIRDSASRKLGKIRSEINKIGNRVRDKMNSIIKNTKYQSILQDSLITIRGDRYVVPVKQEYRNSFSGIVHDQSASGMTLFMEPIAIVKLNNRLRELRKEEEEEIYVILKQLTELVQLNQLNITEDLKAVSILDSIFARASYSQKKNGLAPEINDKGIIKICQGRHPLLKNEPVPIDIAVGENFSTLLITGPNTGGKTVALKTVGLFVLMIELGLHIPAEKGTNIAIFNNIFTDIGDEQSIEHNLSTFSSHIIRIKSLLKNADKNSLVLLDELGAGTDPREGAALAIAVLEQLRKNGVICIATTHYSQLKSYAYSQAGVENASVEFDLETLQPTYRLLMGIPGGSNAIAIAQRLGIEEGIIGEARKLLSGHEIEIEEIITSLNQERRKYFDLKESFLKKEAEADSLKEKYQSLITDFQEKKASILRETREESDAVINQARREIKGIIKDLKSNDFYSRSEIDRKENQINQRLKKYDNRLKEKPAEEIITGKVSIGDQVKIKSIGSNGEVIDLDEQKNEALIKVGVMTIKTDLGDLMKIKIPNENKKEIVHKYRVKKAGKTLPRLDLRGERYENAQERLDKYLDDVFLAGLLQVEIIHGKGTGALREAVEEVLKNNPHISSYRLGKQEEGGSGVTIATILKN